MDDVPDSLGSQLWKYIARKNSNTSSRRGFMGRFLQRAARITEEKGGGSLTLLVFAIQRKEGLGSRQQLQAKLDRLAAAALDEATKAKAIESLERQIAELPDESLASGVPNDFIEEAKAVTDGHVVLMDDVATDGDNPRWRINLRESVARGIAAETVQSRPI